jgi:hypothetical protein
MTFDILGDTMLKGIYAVSVSRSLDAVKHKADVT